MLDEKLPQVLSSARSSQSPFHEEMPCAPLLEAFDDFVRSGLGSFLHLFKSEGTKQQVNPKVRIVACQMPSGTLISAQDEHSDVATKPTVPGLLTRLRRLSQNCTSDQ